MSDIVQHARRAALPATAAALTPVDRRVLELWRRRRRVYKIQNRCDAAAQRSTAAWDHFGNRSNACGDTLNAIEMVIEKHMWTSVLALAATLMSEIPVALALDGEVAKRLYCASLAAIRPALVDVIAEDADRVLAEQDDGATAAQEA
jgi:hypothetical protein